MTSCERYKQYILDCMDDELDILHRKDLESHLKVCEPCSFLANRCRSLKKRLKGLPQVKASDEFPILLRGRIRRELARKRRYRPNFLFFPDRWIPAVGMAVILFVAGVWMVTGNMHSGKKPLEWMKTGAVAPESAENRSEGIQYVIDEIPALEPAPENTESLSAAESSNGPISIDSLLAERRAMLRERMTQVSF